ncbi:MFS transporter [Devosia sp. Root635]|uniref:MFS transporter n=1 Tax=Devosia sp. Root635 TaxID=1736575 RepID=UPI0009EAE3D6|nr:MFS transporter [Devosia sp. Root635]
MQLLDGAIITTSLPVMAQELGVPTLSMSIGVTSYLLSAAIFMPMSSWLADRFGPVRVFLGAIAIFTVASLACGLAQDLPQFVMARIVQGIGGAFMVPVGRAIVLDRASKDEVIHVLAAMIWPALAAPVLGPVLGGAITTYFSWRYNFLLNLPLGLVGFSLVLLLVPDHGRGQPRPFDWQGFLLSAAGLGTLLVGLELFVQGSAHPWLPLGMAVLGVVGSVAAIRHLMSTPTPLLSLEPFRIPTFSRSTISGGSYMRMAVDAMPFLLPLLLQVGLGYDPLQAGSLMLAYFIGNMAMKSVTTPILRRFGFRGVLILNGAISALLIAACAALVPFVPIWAIVALLAFSGLSRSMEFTALSSVAFADIDGARRGVASTLISIVQQMTMVLAVAVATLALKLSQWFRGGDAMTLFDLQVAVGLMALFACASTILLFRLPRDAGDEIAGRSVPAGSKVRS